MIAPQPAAMPLAMDCRMGGLVRLDDDPGHERHDQAEREHEDDPAGPVVSVGTHR